MELDQIDGKRRYIFKEKLLRRSILAAYDAHLGGIFFPLSRSGQLEFGERREVYREIL